MLTVPLRRQRSWLVILLSSQRLLLAPFVPQRDTKIRYCILYLDTESHNGLQVHTYIPLIPLILSEAVKGSDLNFKHHMEQQLRKQSQISALSCS